MREIKFRAWDKYTQKYWNIENWHFEDEYLDLIESGVSIADPNSKRVWRKFNEVKLMQYTGLKDVNGKDIYEGDIVSVDVQDYPAGYARETIFVGVIVFEESTCGFCVKLLKRPKFNGEEFPSEICGLPVSGWDDYEYDYFWFDESVNDEDIEVVGNIHENPELLEDEK